MMPIKEYVRWDAILAPGIHGLPNSEYKELDKFWDEADRLPAEEERLDRRERDRILHLKRMMGVLEDGEDLIDFLSGAKESRIEAGMKSARTKRSNREGVVALTVEELDEVTPPEDKTTRLLSTMWTTGSRYSA